MRYADVKDKKVRFFNPRTSTAGYEQCPSLLPQLEKAVDSLAGKEITLSTAKKVLTEATRNLRCPYKFEMVARLTDKTFCVISMRFRGANVLINFIFV